MGSTHFASFAAYREIQLPSAERALSPNALTSIRDPMITAKIAANTAWNTNPVAGQSTKKDLMPLLERGYDYSMLQCWSSMDDATLHGAVPTISKVKSNAEDATVISDKDYSREDDEDDDTQSIEKQDTSPGSSQSEQSFTIIDTPPGSSASGTSTIRQLTPESLRSASDAMSRHDPSPWLADDMHVGVTQDIKNAHPIWPWRPQIQTQTRTTQHEDDIQVLCGSADDQSASSEQEHENGQSSPDGQTRTSISDREGWRVSPRMARLDQAREATAKDVLAIVSARHFERDFKLALYFNKGALADVVTVLWLDIGRVFHKHHENHEKINDHKQRRCVPEAAISVAVTFAKTSLGPYMVNHVIPQLGLAFWAEDAIQCAWTSVYRRAWDTDVANAAGQFVDDVLEKFMRLGEELDLD